MVAVAGTVSRDKVGAAPAGADVALPGWLAPGDVKNARKCWIYCNPDFWLCTCFSAFLLLYVSFKGQPILIKKLSVVNLGRNHLVSES
jgi:hypothetical protein